VKQSRGSQRSNSTNNPYRISRTAKSCSRRRRFRRDDGTIPLYLRYPLMGQKDVPVFPPSRVTDMTKPYKFAC